MLIILVLFLLFLALAFVVAMTNMHIYDKITIFMMLLSWILFILVVIDQFA